MHLFLLDVTAHAPAPAAAASAAATITGLAAAVMAADPTPYTPGLHPAAAAAAVAPAAALTAAAAAMIQTQHQLHMLCTWQHCPCTALLGTCSTIDTDSTGVTTCHHSASHFTATKSLGKHPGQLGQCLLAFPDVASLI